MSNPIMAIRKSKNNTQSRLEFAEYTLQKMNNLESEDIKASLSRSFGGSHSKGGFKKTRSSSLLKKKLEYAPDISSTPMNKKIKGQSRLMGNMSDMLNLTNKKKPLHICTDQNKILNSIQNNISEQVKFNQNHKKISFYVNALKCLVNYDENLASVIEFISTGIEFCFKQTEPENLFQLNYKLDQYSRQIEGFKSKIAELVKEKKTLDSNVKIFKNVLKFMKKQGVPIKHFFHMFNEKDKIKDKDDGEGKNTDEESKPGIGIPKLNLAPHSEMGFHQEFMAKVDEFSESWRELIKKEKSVS